jgi:GNAT superfamily N-acetyltransferase
MIRYTDSTEGIGPGNLAGFFVGWPNPPSQETHLRILEASGEIVLAIDDETGNVVGFVTAVTDGILSAYIPLLEVLPSHQGRGIGHELVRRLLDVLGSLYMVDLACDPEMGSFYGGFGMRPAHAMVIRRYDRQSGAGGEEHEG